MSDSVVHPNNFPAAHDAHVCAVNVLDLHVDWVREVTKPGLQLATQVTPLAIGLVQDPSVPPVGAATVHAACVRWGNRTSTLSRTSAKKRYTRINCDIPAPVIVIFLEREPFEEIDRGCQTGHHCVEGERGTVRRERTISEISASAGQLESHVLCVVCSVV